MSNDVAIIVKTFLREEPIVRFLDSAKGIAPVYVADDSPITEAKRRAYEGCKVIELPFDSGVSRGRNALVDEAKEPYVLVCDDDFVLEGINFDKAKKLLEKYDIVCGTLMEPQGVRRYEITFNVRDGVLYKTKASGEQIDMGLHFFLARTETMRQLRWDENIPIGGDHLDLFLRAKQNGLKVAFCPELSAYHLQDTSHAEYNRKRGRNYLDYVLKKHGYTGVVDAF